MFSLSLTSMTGDSPTFDEQGFLVRGLAYLRGEENGGNRHIRVGHPLGLNALNAALLVADPSVHLPSDDPSWSETSFHRPAELFLWEIGNDVEHIMFLARVPTIWLGIILAAVGMRWAAEMAARWGGRTRFARRLPEIAGLISLLLIAFDPNILAHTRFITTDLGLTATATIAGFALWRFLRRPSWIRAMVTGVGLGLLLNTKFTAILFLPLFGLVILLGFIRLWRARTADSGNSLWRQAVGGVVILPIVGFIVLWVGNGLQIGPLRAPLPVIGQLGGMAVPLSNYLDQLLDIGGRLDVSTPSFLLGHYSDSGWWYYFPVAFALKTPLPTIILLIGSSALTFKLAISQREMFSKIWFDLISLLIPAAGFFAVALTTDINLGYRHILPVLPFLHVFAGVILSQLAADRQSHTYSLLSRAVTVFLIWLVVISLWIYPHYLSFFNLLAGGSGNGWRSLVDSNLDWGQDLSRLADWLKEKEVDQVWLSYFGEARPEYYGVDYAGLDSFPPRLINPNARIFYPDDPAPGWYAISATNLQGVHFEDHDQFLFFRERDPQARIGNSIFLYEQPARGAQVDLLLANLQVDQLAPDDFALFGTNDVVIRWFGPGQAILLPGSENPAWLAIDAQAFHPLLKPYLGVEWGEPVASRDGYHLYHVTPAPPEDTAAGTDLQLNDGEIAFIDVLDLVQSGSSLTVLTAWRQNASPQPVKMFIHVLDNAGQIAAQWDGLGAAWEGWREGDTLIQVHDLSLDSVPSGDYRVVAGLYEPENLQRWTTQSGYDFIELGSVIVP